MGEHILPANPPRAQDIGEPAHGLDVPRGRLDELYLRHGPDALRLALLLTGDGPLAQDLVQEAFLRLGGRLVHLRDPEAFPSYLRRTVVNLANSHFRRRLLERRHHARVGPNDVWAVGATLAAGAPGQVNPLIEHWDGSAWSQVTGVSPLEGMVGGELEAVAVVSADDVWAVGYAVGSDPNGLAHPLIERWDGRTWSLAASPDPSTAQAGTILSAVSATSANDAWAVGDGPGGTFVLHWDGTAWSQVDAPGSPPDDRGLGSQLRAVAVIAPDDVWAAGNLVGNHRYPLSQDGSVSVLDSQPYFLHWDGQDWTKVDGPPWSGGDVTRISALAASGPTDVWAVGLRYLPDPRRYEELVLHWNGTAWTHTAIEEFGGAAPHREMIGAASAPDGSAWFAGIGSDRPFGLDGGRPTPLVAVGTCSR